MYNEKWLQTLEEMHAKEARGELSSEEDLAMAIADFMATAMLESFGQMCDTLEDTFAELAKRRGESASHVPLGLGLDAGDMRAMVRDMFKQFIANSKVQ